MIEWRGSEQPLVEHNGIKTEDEQAIIRSKNADHLPLRLFL
jgi:hypothetical protein